MRVLTFAFVVLGLFLVGESGCNKLVGVDFDAVHLGDSDAAASVAEAGGSDGGACAPQGCDKLGFACGTQNDGCGNAIPCGSCTAGTSCAKGKCACTPTTCPALGVSCGTQNDGCGHALDCGTCGASESCTNNKCACQPKSCVAQGATCGDVPDGCGNTFQCGTCAAPLVCGGGGANKCGTAPCTPTTCAAQGKNCGKISDGCGSTLDCGACTSPSTCGGGAGGGTANVCGCTPTTCAAQGKSCGSIADGCGGTLSCGNCTSPDSCGGGGTANVCGCAPTTCAALGKNCGAVANGCGGTLDCGACTSPDTCGAITPNLCGCVHYQCVPGDCGILSNGCGGTINCGTCGTCFGAGTPITMADGSVRPIERVVAGETVQSFDPVAGRFVTARVLATVRHGAAESTRGLIVVNGTLHVTGNHPLYADGHATRADQLVVGQTIMTLGVDGAPREDVVRSLGSLPGGVETFDLKVDGPGTYLAAGIVALIKP